MAGDHTGPPPTEEIPLVPNERPTRRARGLIGALVTAVLCAVAGAGLAHGSPAPGARVMQASPAVDALWALAPDGSSISVCQDPTASASITTCFDSASQITLPVQTKKTLNSYPMTTDGTNVYFGLQPGYSCPIGGYGTNCTQVQVGWRGVLPVVLAAGDGYLFFSAVGGSVLYRCPANLPYTQATSMPSGCVVLDNAGSNEIASLAYANGTVYAGLSESGLLWSCDANQVNACTILDVLAENGGDVPVQSLAVGGGYVWAGLAPGGGGSGSSPIWRCPPGLPNYCSLWDTAGYSVVSLADDGAGTLWAAVVNTGDQQWTHPGEVIWSCPEAYANGCTNVISNVFPYQVTAGGGHGFSAVSNGPKYPPIAYGATQYPRSVVWASKDNTSVPGIVYTPAGGTAGLGGVRVQVKAPTGALARVCARRGTLSATIRVRGPHTPRVARAVTLCSGGYPVREASKRFDLLYPGAYSVTVRSAAFSGSARVVITRERTVRRVVRLRAAMPSR